MTPRPGSTRIGLTLTLFAVLALVSSACTSTTLEEQGFPASTSTTEEEDRSPDDTGDGPTTDRDDRAIDAVDSAVVTLVDAGAEPRQPLRFRLTEGTVQDLEMVMDMTMEMSGTGEAADASNAAGDIPRITMPLTAEVTDVDDRGSAQVEATYHDVIVDPDATMDPDEREAVEDALSMMGGSGISITQSNRGQLIYGEIEGFGAPLGGTSVDAQSQLASLAVPFPVEAVGVGAVWTVDQEIESGPLLLEQRATYTITAIEGDLISLTSRIEVGLAPGADDLGPDGTIEHFTVSEDGQTTIDLTSPLPRSASSTTEQSMVVTAPPGSVGSLDQRTIITLTMTSA